MSKIDDLLVYKHKDEIIKKIEQNNVVIIESPTGSGKTTGIPLILYEAGFANSKKIGVTQPRRVAALNVSSYIRELTSLDSSYISAKMRFYDESGDDTKIKVMTDGILLEEIKSDKLLSQYSIIMVDEAHERSLNIDFCLGLLKEILAQRDDFKVIVSSATINTELFSTYFDNAPIISLSGKSYNVDVIYSELDTKKDELFLYNKRFDNRAKRDSSLIVRQIVDICTHCIANNYGDILIFLSGERLIKEACKALNKAYFKKNVVLYPLYSRLSREEQLRVFIPTPKNSVKIVVATNIAETSITIDGIRVVIDSGFEKNNFYDQNRFTSSLNECRITKSSAEQRKGRAGRTSDGVCYRLYSQDDFEAMDEFLEPEIKNADLSEVVLRMCDLGINDANNFQFITNVNKENIKSAYETLRYLDLIDNDNNLTAIGKFVSKFPLPPRLGRVLAESVFMYPSSLERICTILAFLSTKSPLVTSDLDPKISRDAHFKFAEHYGDLVAYLSIYDEFIKFDGDREAQEKWCVDNYFDFIVMQEIVSIKNQLESMLSDLNIPISNDASIKEYIFCLCAGLKQFICKKIKGYDEYSSLFAKNISLSPSCLLEIPVIKRLKNGKRSKKNLKKSSHVQYKPEYIVAAELMRTNRLYAYSVARIDESWIAEMNISFDEDTKIKKSEKKNHKKARLKKRR